MKKALLLFVFALTVLTFNFTAEAQKKSEQQETVVNPMEIDARHNLEVSWQYFKLKKAYVAVVKRLQETVAAYPEFSQMDEVHYLLGMSSFYLANGKGKQQIDMSKLTDDEKAAYTPENLRGDAIMHLTEIVEKYPNSKFRKDAEKTLRQMQTKR